MTSPASRLPDAVAWWAPALGLVGLLLAVAAPAVWHGGVLEGERQAAELIVAVHRSQEVFRQAGGRGGYASEVRSLVTPCPGEPRAALSVDAEGFATVGSRYRVILRGARESRAVGADCHGRPTVSDYYVSASPSRNGVDGRLALATTSNGRVFVMFDGVAPLEPDMAPGGLAVPLDSLDSFKIP